MKKWVAIIMTIFLVLSIISCVFEYPHRSPFTYTAIMDSLTRIEQPPTMLSNFDYDGTPDIFGNIKPILDKLFTFGINAGYLITYPIRLIIWCIDTIGTIMRISGLQNVFDVTFGGWQ